jgi:hypothetical protein
MTIQGILVGHLTATSYHALQTLDLHKDHQHRKDMTTMHDYCSLGGEEDQQRALYTPSRPQMSGAACISPARHVSLPRLAAVAAWRRLGWIELGW